MGEGLAKAIVGVVAIGWVVSAIILPAAIKGFSPPPGINTVMGTVAGAAAAVLFTKKGDKDKDDGKSARKTKRDEEGASP